MFTSETCPEHIQPSRDPRLIPSTGSTDSAGVADTIEYYDLGKTETFWNTVQNNPNPVSRLDTREQPPVGHGACRIGLGLQNKINRAKSQSTFYRTKNLVLYDLV